ncbi:UNVERIFIED_CONTAM: hypothetical protein Sradi_4282100 [Sesamum radiatum]|uniref:Uncharacterized protein n=1 Tax=Sesamum radiatum TaxID=300843 RepID=A0AAW2NMP3_SESRA
MGRFLACLIFITAASVLASAEISEEKLVTAEAPTAARKLGKHTLLQGKIISATSRRLSPAEPPKAEENGCFQAK